MVDSLQAKAEHLREEVAQVVRAAARQVVRLVLVVEDLRVQVMITQVITLRLRRNQLRKRTVMRRITKRIKESRILRCKVLRLTTKVC